MKGLQRAALHVRWKSAYTDLFAAIAEPLQRVEEFLRQSVQSSVQNITDMAMHLLSAGGKRLRPALTLLSAQILGDLNERAIAFAAVVELTHTATLIHDDVIDHAELRRGRATVHHLWGNEAAVMCGDFLYARAVSILADIGDVEVIRTIAYASSQTCAGEVLELQLAFNPSVTEEQCLEVARMKTAELIAAACKVGALAVHADPEAVAALDAFGRQLGIAFQIVDDVLDLEGNVEEIGKPVGSDLLEGKITLPIRYTLDMLSLQEQQKWVDQLVARNILLEDAVQFAQLAMKHGVLRRTREIARQFVQRALEILSRIAIAPSPQSLNAKTLLERLAHFVTERTL